MHVLSIKEVQSLQLELMKKLHLFFSANHIQYYLIAGSALGAFRHKGFIPWDDDIDIGLFRDEYEKFLELAGQFEQKYEIVNSRNADNCDFCLTRIYIPGTMIDIPEIQRTALDKRLYMDIFPLDNVPDNQNECDDFEKKIVKKKKLISRIDVRNYNNGVLTLFCKKLISLCLVPFRQSILTDTEDLMKKYNGHYTQRVCSLCSQYSFKKQVMSRKIYGRPTLYQFEDTTFYGPECIDDYLKILYGNDFMQVPPVEKRRHGHSIYSV